MPGPEGVGPRDLKGRQRLAEYLLRAPFLGGRSLGVDPSLQKIHWNPATQTVIYRSRRSWHTKRNFEVFPATILRFHGGSFEWQAIGRPMEMQSALNSLWFERATKRGCSRKRLATVCSHVLRLYSPFRTEP